MLSNNTRKKEKKPQTSIYARNPYRKTKKKRGGRRKTNIFYIDEITAVKSTDHTFVRFLILDISTTSYFLRKQQRRFHLVVCIATFSVHYETKPKSLKLGSSPCNDSVDYAPMSSVLDHNSPVYLFSSLKKTKLYRSCFGTDD